MPLFNQQQRRLNMNAIQPPSQPANASCLTRLANNLCSKQVWDGIQITSLGAALFASAWIPIGPIAAASIGLSGFSIFEKIYSLSDNAINGGPRSWKQLIGGGTIITAAAPFLFCGPNIWLRLAGGAGVALSMCVTHSNELADRANQCYDRASTAYAELLLVEEEVPLPAD